MSFLDELNTEQREAAEALTGPLLIIAGAGSGKTRTLTYRIANLIATNTALPWQILAVTFTNKAAEEMKRRVEKLMVLGEMPMMGTFHSICVRILRRHFDRLGREKSFVIYDATDTLSLMKRVMKELSVDEESIKPQAALGMISKCKNELKGAADFQARAGNHFERLVGNLFAEYEKRLRANNAVDFDDLLKLTVELFRSHPDVLDGYQERWRFINVDEYQDTNHAQYILTKLLAAKYRNLCVIGDSDQSIYSFRGADMGNILDFEKDYSDAKLIKLEQNYRSTQNILDAADAVIEKNEQRKPKKMWTEQKGGDLIEVWHLRSDYEEAERIAQEIRRLRQEEDARLSDVVVLYRTNAQSRLIEEALLRSGLPYKVIGGVKFYARKEVKDLLAYLRLIHNANDTDALLRVINVPPRRIGDSSIQKLQNFALGRTLTLAEVMNHLPMITELGASAKSAMESFWANIMKWRDAAKTKIVSELLKDIIAGIRYKEFLLDGTEEGEMRYENIQELQRVAEKYDSLEAAVSLESFLEEVALVADTDQLDANADALTMMTLHSVKGLEYPFVFIAGCEENIFPHSRSLYDAAQMEEERRLMYVGITRAMKRLYLLAAKQRSQYGTAQMNTLSRFINDIPEGLMKKVGVRENAVYGGEPSLTGRGATTFLPEAEPEAPRTAEEKFKDGDRVAHATYGEGIVVERRGDLVTIVFTNKQFGIKKFAAAIAPLEKVSP